MPKRKRKETSEKVVNHKREPVELSETELEQLKKLKKMFASNVPLWLAQKENLDFFIQLEKSHFGEKRGDMRRFYTDFRKKLFNFLTSDLPLSGDEIRQLAEKFFPDMRRRKSELNRKILPSFFSDTEEKALTEIRSKLPSHINEKCLEEVIDSIARLELRRERVTSFREVSTYRFAMFSFLFFERTTYCPNFQTFSAEISRVKGNITRKSRRRNGENNARFFGEPPVSHKEELIQLENFVRRLEDALQQVNSLFRDLLLQVVGSQDPFFENTSFESISDVFLIGNYVERGEEKEILFSSIDNLIQTLRLIRGANISLEIPMDTSFFNETCYELKEELSLYLKHKDNENNLDALSKWIKQQYGETKKLLRLVRTRCAKFEDPAFIQSYKFLREKSVANVCDFESPLWLHA